MTRLRQRLASWLLDLAVRVEPVVPAAPSLPPARLPAPTRMVDGVRVTAYGVHPEARAAAEALRKVASEVELGVVIGFRVIWYGPPRAVDAFMVVPPSIGEA